MGQESPFSQNHYLTWQALRSALVWIPWGKKFLAVALILSWDFLLSLGIPQSIHGSQQTLHTTRGLSKETSVWSSPTCGINWEVGPALSLPWSWATLTQYSRHCTSVCFILYGNYISRDFPNLNRLHFRYTLFIPQSKGAKAWHAFNQAQPTPNGSFRDFSSGSEVPIWGTRFWSLVRELKYTCYS